MRRIAHAMRSNPPTRRSRRSPNGDSSLPIIPILIGVIVLGFVIGAGLSLAGRHDVTLVAAVSPPPQANRTFAPVTPAPTERPTAQPTQAPTEKPSRVSATFAPSSATATVVDKATLRPRAVTAAPAASFASATGRPIARDTSSPAAAVAQASVTLSPASPGEASSTLVPAPVSNASAGGTQADSAFAKLSAAVVRQYLEAVKRGDQDGAYAALGASPGSKGASLSEAGVIDSQTRVGRIDAHAAANDDALVSVQLQTASGPYYGQYTVHKTDTGAAVIVAHSIVKP